VLSLAEALDMTLEWYSSVKAGQNARQKCLTQLASYAQHLASAS
jgi:hypothetical protein